MLMVHSAMAAMTGAGLSGGPARGHQLITGNANFEVPAGFSTICAAVMSPGGNSYQDEFGNYFSGQGGSLRWVNDLAVTEGEILNTQFSQPGFNQRPAGAFRRGSTELVRAGNSPIGTGFDGGQFGGGPGEAWDGGGAAGWTANGPTSQPTTSAFLGGRGTSPYGPTYPPIPATGYNGANYGGGGHSYGGVGGLGFVFIIWGEGRSFPDNIGEVS